MKSLRVQKFKSLSLAGILLAATMLTACSSDNSLVEDIPPVQQPSQSGSEQVYTVTVNATKGGETRALSVEGSDISATWSVGDEVTVYNVTKSADLSGTLVAQSTGDATVLKGDLTGTINNGDVLKLKYLSPSYDTQDGTLEYIATHCDYAEANVTVSAVSGSSIATTDAAFANRQAIVKFTLKDKANGNLLSVSELTLQAGDNLYSITSASARSEIYVAVPAILYETVSLIATPAGEDYYYYEKEDIRFVSGKYYPIVVNMSLEPLARPITFEAKKAGTRVTFTAATFMYTSGITPIEYNKYDGAGWKTYSSAITLTNVGDKVSFRGTNRYYAEWGHYSIFSCSDESYIYGNIMSLTDKSKYANNTSWVTTHAFSHMFYNNTNIYNHPAKDIILPDTYLAGYCYNEMFSGCTSLTKAPELPAETLLSNCYNKMFSGCTNLTTAPELPATTLADYCYYDMFSDCTSLTDAPALNAEIMASSCYSGMFQNCTSLTTAPELPATTLANGCYAGMFKNCTSLTTAPDLPVTSLTSNCYNSMFSGCTSLTTAPDLPATTLVDYCYSYMFDGCSNLSSIKCLATDISASMCTYGWVNNVKSTGTFTKASGVDWSGLTEGFDGIPSGWTVLQE